MRIECLLQAVHGHEESQHLLDKYPGLQRNEQLLGYLAQRNASLDITINTWHYPAFKARLQSFHDATLRTHAVTAPYHSGLLSMGLPEAVGTFLSPQLLAMESGFQQLGRRHCLLSRCILARTKNTKYLLSSSGYSSASSTKFALGDNTT